MVVKWTHQYFCQRILCSSEFQRKSVKILSGLFLVEYLTQSLALLQCLKQYVELLIKEGLETAISCPDAACPKRGHLQENEVCFYCGLLVFFFP